MAETYTVQLERVQAAIAEIESGCQSYQIKDRQMAKANLETLYKREEKLRVLAAREAGGGGIRVRGITPVT
jgi:hypothetical protein